MWLFLFGDSYCGKNGSAPLIAGKNIFTGNYRPKNYRGIML
ncbi:MAG: hypothetical protein AB1444_08515 [Spirochaetota bacterium]